MYLPDPPCCNIPGSRYLFPFYLHIFIFSFLSFLIFSFFYLFREHCNESCCCISIGKFGFEWFDKNRKIIMPILSFLSFICLILGTVALASLSHKDSVVMDTYWVKLFYITLPYSIPFLFIYLIIYLIVIIPFILCIFFYIYFNIFTFLDTCRS